ncbi:dihydroxyacetone kinase subunit DhaL [Salisediminibacterium halotolerans]|uniref:dihydroxyacetone kinase subunit DhaL n=1 Tax=Salisediminibacterium halotolerans TaxID=517425 RepID=UPI000EAEEF0A|nr:dihydroxyacetone kinase subunit DhaL [Salisediminibacterium halotolerans]RLJ69280.1 dihydroxyacetone kinase DhaL subunit [Actinophytocola xinjiangensis]RPE86985.1 dihydroxyacetone kinase DhaL subunit [Salisediminibacterium halotolerans]TWG32282.1 dihydroxyacetone kinase DhaL subunit [Salisediminibacterium halotolerans]GEL08932.1 dihydroxyacetone kinase subunit L [Salisediminibacterium halotolerans]
MLTAEQTNRWLERFAEKIEANKDYLSELDGIIGDGDHGNNMARGIEEMRKKLQAADPANGSEVLKNASVALLSKIGGAAGPLYGTALLEMSKQMTEADDLSAVVKAGLDGVQKRGKAEEGEKTMVDVFAPVYRELEAGNLTVEAVEDAVEATRELKATKGRASYLGERSIGELDPGAVSIGYLFISLIEEGLTDV